MAKDYLSVVMKTNSKEERFAETKKVLDYAFANFSKQEILSANSKIKGSETLPVNKGKENQVNIETTEEINLVMKKGQVENLEPVLILDKKKLNEEGQLTAPIKKGDKVGTLTIKSKDGSPVEFLANDGIQSVTVDVVAAEDVEKANWFVLSMRAIGGFFGDIWGSVSSTVKGWF